MTFVIPEKQEVTQLCLPGTLKTDNGSNSLPLRASQTSLGAKHRTRDSHSSLFHRRHPGSTMDSSVEITNTGLVTAVGELIKQLHSGAIKHGWWHSAGAEHLPNVYIVHISQPQASERGEEDQQCPYHSTPSGASTLCLLNSVDQASL